MPDLFGAKELPQEHVLVQFFKAQAEEQQALFEGAGLNIRVQLEIFQLPENPDCDDVTCEYSEATSETYLQLGLWDRLPVSFASP